jgi:pyruvate-formate lyase-activating enzyme
MDRITANDIRQMKAAREAERWLRSPEQTRFDSEDRIRREAEWIALGHSLKCGILRCHPECKKNPGG